MSLPEQFWWFLTALCVIWYFTVTVYVMIRGALDIRNMLSRLEAQHRANHRPSSAAGGQAEAEEV